MTILDHWLERPTFEVFPASGIEDAVTKNLRTGARVAVTHSPRHGLERSASIACELARRGFEPVLHIGAKGVESTEILARVVAGVRDAGVREAMLIGGDGADPSGPYPTAVDLLRAVSELTPSFPRIGVAGHPEGHPHASEAVLLDALLEKQRLGATYVVTQMCFDATAWRSWATAVSEVGVRLPVSVGVPGVVSRRKLLEIGLRAGAGPSLRALRGQSGFARRTLAARAGDYAPDELLVELAAAPGVHRERISSLHLFTFNSIAPTAAWADSKARESATDEVSRHRVDEDRSV